MKKVTFLFVLVIAGGFVHDLFTTREERTVAASKKVATTKQVLVPEPFDIQHDLRPVDGVPWAGPEDLQAAIQIILSLEKDPGLQGERDQAIIALLKKYSSGERTATWRYNEHILPAGDTSGRNVGRMGFACPFDTFAVAPTRGTPPVLAISLYHELDHAVQCDEELARTKLSRDAFVEAHKAEYIKNPCQSEELPYAAQVRLFTVLLRRHLLPTVIAVGDNNDSSVLEQTLDVWYPLYDGRFCPWYKAKLAAGSDAPGQRYLKEVGE